MSGRRVTTLRRQTSLLPVRPSCPLLLLLRLLPLESIFHPTCCTCSLGFVSIVAFVEHKARCPPPGSFKAKLGAFNGHGRPAALADNSVLEQERTTRAMQDEDWATAELSSGILSALPFAGSDCSEVFSATSTRPITPATPKTQRAPR
ncbi:hypothetical protein C8T65DRAFT_627161 [Cerioporus squamosus]|nr:hypothetical protein C8T65DRAFT_627161 [Cerioporus squamosus]